MPKGACVVGSECLVKVKADRTSLNEFVLDELRLKPELMTSLPETSTATTVTNAVAGPVSREPATAGTAASTNVLTTLLDTIRATVRDELQ